MAVIRENLSVPSASDGVIIDALLMTPEDGAKAVVQILHGMAEYKERYEDFARALCEAGFACLLHDHRGHGRSASDKRDLGHFGKGGADALIEDADAVWRAVADRFPDKKRVLMGHSMGSLVAREYAAAHDGELAGLIVCGCPAKNDFLPAGLALTRAMRLFRGGRARSRLIDYMAFGAFGRAVKDAVTPFDWLNTDAGEVQKYIDDPLCGFGFTLNGYEGLFRLMRRVYAKKQPKARNADMPVLFVSGADDPCMIRRDKLRDAMGYMRRRGYEDVRAILYEGQRHEILLSPARGNVYRDLCDWTRATCERE